MGSLFQLLDHEWATEFAHCPTRARLLHDVCAIVGATDLDDLRRRIDRGGPCAAQVDEVLAALAARANPASEATGRALIQFFLPAVSVRDHVLMPDAGVDELASRVLLQFLLPGVRRLPSCSSGLGDRSECQAAAVAATYIRIRGHLIHKRPRKIASNVLMDAARELRAQTNQPHPISPHLMSDFEDAFARVPDAGRRPTQRDLIQPLWFSSARGEPRAHEELLEVLATAVDAGHLAAADAQLIAHTRIRGGSLAGLAADRHTTVRTLQRRRRAAEHVLADVAVAA